MTRNNTDILVEVRKAYRLLFDYQAKLLGLVKYIGGNFGYTYKGGLPKFSANQPRLGHGSLDNWAWDWLNLYFHEFYFGDKIDAAGNKLTFSVFILADDGYFQTLENNEADFKRLNVDKFEKVEFSKSKLILVVGHNCWTVNAFFCENNWCNKHFTLEEKGLHKDEAGKMFFKSYALENFFEEHDAKKQLEDFEKECNLLGIPFNQIEVKVG